MADVQVIGGGFSGCSAAYFLMRASHRVRLVETGERLGGMLETLSTPYGPVERAANALISNATLERVAADLGITLVPALKTSRKRYIYRDGRLRRWPISLASTARVLGLALPLRFSNKVSPLAPQPRESLQAWGERALGAEATNFLLAPGLSGVYAGDPREMSASLTVGKLFRARTEAKRLPRGKLRGSVAPLTGMGAWAPAFRRVLELNGTTFARDVIPGVPTVVALPPPQAALFLQDRSPALAAELRKIRMLPIVSVTLFLAPETQAIPGFGCLFPRGQKFRTLGVLANDRIFANRALDSISETWILGGALDPEILKLSDVDLIHLVIEERARLHGLKGRALHTKISRWESAIPHYDLRLEEAVEHLKAMQFRDGLYRLFGTYLGDLGLGTVLHRASELAKEFP